MYICRISNDSLDVISARKSSIKNDEFQLKLSHFSLSSILEGLLHLVYCYHRYLKPTDKLNSLLPKTR